MAWENQDDGFIAKILKPDGEDSIRAPQPGNGALHDMLKMQWYVQGRPKTADDICCSIASCCNPCVQGLQLHLTVAWPGL